MQQTAENPIVVGVDGSEGSDLAVRWAAAEAAARSLPLRIVSGYEPVPQFWVRDFPVMTDGALDQIRQAAEADVTRAADGLREQHPGLEVIGVAVESDPVGLLVTESDRSSLVVIGSRRLGAVGSLVLGSVANGVAPRTRCPLVVLRGPGDGETADGSAEQASDGAAAAPAVVAGVDGSAATESVLDCAIGFADRWGAALRVVMCWPYPVMPGLAWTPELPVPDEVTGWLAEAVAARAEQYPGVSVHTEVIYGRPVDSLVEVSRGQRLLVVGTRGRSALAGVFLGSVSQGVLHHSTGPVAVVPVAASE